MPENNDAHASMPAADQIWHNDILARKQKVESILKIMDRYARSGEGCMFTLNGKWGSGKSFVLDKLRQTIQQRPEQNTVIDSKKENGETIHTLQEYLYVDFNSWKNDYHAEPLISIATVLAKQLQELAHEKCNKITHWSPGAQRAATKAADVLISGADAALSVLGIFNPAIILKEQKDNLISLAGKNSIYLQSQRKGDTPQSEFLMLSGIITAFQHTLDKLYEKTHIPMLIVVDELDRCLPEYAVKVLERLNHLIDGISNIIVLVAVDREQLDENIRTAYGAKIDAKEYLRKFITLEIELGVGSFSEQYHAYFNKFIINFQLDHNVNVAYQIISDCFEGISIRTRIQLIERATLIHELFIKSSETEKHSSSLMCFEIFCIVLIQYYRVGTDMLYFILKHDLRDIKTRIKQLKESNRIHDAKSLEECFVIKIEEVFSNLDYRQEQNYVLLKKRDIISYLYYLSWSIEKEATVIESREVLRFGGLVEESEQKQINDALEFFKHIQDIG